MLYEVITHAVPQAEADVLEIELAGFDLGEIEDVVEHAEQGIGGVFHDAQVFALFVIELCFERQVRHADDRVHRRADLMTHVGEEVALGPVRVFGDLLGLVITSYSIHYTKLYEAAVADVRTQLDALIVPRFLSEMPFERLAHYPRYLKAAVV